MNIPEREAVNRIPIEDLYQEVILDHNRRPRNFKALERFTASCHGHNPLCGDDYRIFLLKGADGTIEDIGFTGKGCAISKASGSMMTAKVKGRSFADARAVKNAFLELVTKDAPAADPQGSEALLGSLNIFAGVKKYPIRVKCATLVWHTLEEALTQAGHSAVSSSSGGTS